MSAALCVAGVDAAGSSFAPLSSHVSTSASRHLDVALEADVPAADHIGLMRVERVGEHGRRARRQRERVVVPLEGRERGAAAEPFPLRGNVADVDVEPADLGDRSARDRRAQRLREELPAEAVAEHRDVVGRPPRAAAPRAARSRAGCRSTLIGPPISAIPANARGSAGTGAPSSSATSCHASPRASSQSAKYAGPSVREKRKIAIGRIGVVPAASTRPASRADPSGAVRTAR